MANKLNVVTKGCASLVVTSAEPAWKRFRDCGVALCLAALVLTIHYNVHEFLGAVR